MKNILATIKAHKVISTVIGGVLVASGATVATFVVLNAQGPISESAASQDTHNALLHTESGQGSIASDEPQDTIDPIVETPTQQPAIIGADIDQKRTDCIEQGRQWYRRELSTFVDEWNGMTDEEKTEYGDIHRYRLRIAELHRKWNTTSDCAPFLP